MSTLLLATQHFLFFASRIFILQISTLFNVFLFPWDVRQLSFFTAPQLSWYFFGVLEFFSGKRFLGENSIINAYLSYHPQIITSVLNTHNTYPPRKTALCCDYCTAKTTLFYSHHITSKLLYNFFFGGARKVPEVLRLSY